MVFFLEGTLTNKQRREAFSRISELRLTKNKVMLMATASLIGEGFDLPALDPLNITSSHLDLVGGSTISRYVTEPEVVELSSWIGNSDFLDSMEGHIADRQNTAGRKKIILQRINKFLS